MRVTIIGAGVVGATTAYFVAQQGHEVTLLDRCSEPARGASFANAGQLSYSYTDTLASPGLLRRLPSMLLGRDSGMHIRLDRALIPWGLRFLRECTRERSDRNTLALLQLASSSARALDELLEHLPLRFGHRAAGKLMLTSSPRTLRELGRRAVLKQAHGVRLEILGSSDCRTIEPALEGWRGTIAGAVYASQDSAGDARTFTGELCRAMLARNMCRFLTGVDVLGLLQRKRTVVGLRTSRGELSSDAVIVCAGADSARLLRCAGLCVPIYPLKGYSITPPAGARPPHVSLTDLDRRLVFANLEGRIRLAGLADCVGANAGIDAQRVQELVRLGREVLPEAAQFDAPLNAWAGLRPATPSGIPVVGATRLRGLYLNLGHGALGWTLACGTARQLAEQHFRRTMPSCA